jgi:hypothetical protein
MAETGLSYEGDIAPLKQQYFQQVFSDPRLNPRAAAALSSQFSASVDKSFAQRQELQDRASVTRSRELQFETAKFTLEREREKAARERSSMTELAPLLATFDSIIKDPTTDNKTKSILIGQTATQQSPLIAQSPAARIAYDATVRSLTPEDRPETNFTLGSYILQGGDTSFLPAGLEDSPTVSISPLTYATGIRKTKQAYGESIARSEASAAQTKREQSQIDKAIAAIGSAVTKPKYAEGSSKAVGAEFESPAVRGSFDYLINRFGTPEEKAKAKAGDASVLVGITNSIIPRVLSGETAATTGPTEGQKARAIWGPAPK